MVPTIYPYGSVSIEEVDKIEQKGDKFYVYDKCGRWRISEATYHCLEARFGYGQE